MQMINCLSYFIFYSIGSMKELTWLFRCADVTMPIAFDKTEVADSSETAAEREKTLESVLTIMLQLQSDALCKMHVKNAFG